jgi:iron complex transport system ATP-binding protein
MVQTNLELRLTNIRFRYPDSEWELRVPEFRLYEGLLLGIIGPNGSGKSTLLRLAAGIGTLLDGYASLNGRDLTRLPRREIARMLGYLPQEIASSYDYTVEEVVRMGRYPHLKGLGGLGREDLDAVEESLKLTGLFELRKRSLSRLSGGEKKRAFLASVLAQKPRLLLLDEPTGALDVHRGVQFFKILRHLSLNGIGIAVVTHDLNFASLFCQSIVLLSGGQTMAQGDPSSVLSQRNLQAVYGPEILIQRHPETGRPLVLPRIEGGEP